MKEYDQIKENRSFSQWGWMVPILKMRRFLCLLRLSLPPEMGEIAQTFMSEIEWLAALKCRATGLSTSLFLTERRCSANLSDRPCKIIPCKIATPYGKLTWYFKRIFNNGGDLISYINDSSSRRLYPGVTEPKIWTKRWRRTQESGKLLEKAENREKMGREIKKIKQM